MQITITIDDDLGAEIRALAEKEHRSISGQVSFLCDTAIKLYYKDRYTLPGDRELSPPPTVDGPKGSGYASTDAVNAGDRS